MTIGVVLVVLFTHVKLFTFCMWHTMLLALLFIQEDAEILT